MSVSPLHQFHHFNALKLPPFQPPPTSTHRIPTPPNDISVTKEGNKMSSTSEINRANAEHSTGPVTEAGKQRSSQNALRHGLTAQTVVLPQEDIEAYQSQLKSFTAEYHPKGATECNLVQALADATWRLNRIPTLEASLLSVAPDDDLTGTALLAFLERQAKALAVFSTHSQRLSRQIEKTLAQLKDIQGTRLWITNHPGLDDLRQGDVAKQRQRQERPELPRQRHESQRPGQRRKRQLRADAHDENGRHRQLPARARLDERNQVRADDVDDERLRHDGFDKPAGVEQRGGVSVIWSASSAKRATSSGVSPTWLHLKIKPHHGKKWCNRKSN